MNYEKTMKEWDDSVPDGIKYLSAEKQVLMRRVRELEAENKHLKEAMRWKSIKEVIPEQGQNILLCYPLISAVVNDIYKRQYNEKDLNFYTIHNAYWMPIPESLKVNNGN